MVSLIALSALTDVNFDLVALSKLSISMFALMESPINKVLFSFTCLGAGIVVSDDCIT